MKESFIRTKYDTKSHEGFSKEKLVLDLLRDGRRRWVDFERMLVKSGKMSRSTLARLLKSLEGDRLVRRVVDKTKTPPEVWYELLSYKTKDEEGLVNMIRDLRDYELYRNPEIEEIVEWAGVRFGRKVDKESVYKVLKDVGWNKPREQDYVEAKRERAKYLILASYLKHLPDSGEVKKASKEDIKKAKRLLVSHPELVPEIWRDNDSGKLYVVWKDIVWKSNLIEVVTTAMHEVIIMLPDGSLHVGIKEGSGILHNCSPLKGII
jgi:DNA-binding HxlR family transcriptional regulator